MPWRWDSWIMYLMTWWLTRWPWKLSFQRVPSKSNSSLLQPYLVIDRWKMLNHYLENCTLRTLLNNNLMLIDFISTLNLTKSSANLITFLSFYINDCGRGVLKTVFMITFLTGTWGLRLLTMFNKARTSSTSLTWTPRGAPLLSSINPTLWNSTSRTSRWALIYLPQKLEFGTITLNMRHNFLLREQNKPQNSFW